MKTRITFLFLFCGLSTTFIFGSHKDDEPREVSAARRLKKHDIIITDEEEEALVKALPRKRKRASNKQAKKAVTKAAVKKTSKAAAPRLFFVADDVELREGRGKKDTFYWHIYAQDIRRGYVTIAPVTAEDIGDHYSLQIFINKRDQGKHLGQIAYQKACGHSGLDCIYAHMRKSNIASRKAAEKAGFIEDKAHSAGQLTMVWRKK